MEMDDKVMLVEEYNFWVPRIINVLGTNYEVKLMDMSADKDTDEGSFITDNDFCAFCNNYDKTIILTNLRDEKWYPTYKHLSLDAIVEAYKETLRHELFHAVFGCCGLKGNSHSSGAFAMDEELIDFLAIQSPKIFEIFKNANIL